MNSVKAIFYLKKEEADSASRAIVHTETINQSVYASTYGHMLHVEFNDGETIHGTAHKYNPNDKGFFVVPLSPVEKYERIYVNAGAVKRVESRRLEGNIFGKKLVGNILIEQKKITRPQLEKALLHQQERQKKIGTILKEQNLITNEQLEESLQKQKEKAKFIGEILMGAGYISEEQLQFALRVQQEKRKKKLGGILVELKYVTPNDICIALATQLQLPWADLSSLVVPPMAVAALPGDVIKRLEVIPVELKDNTLIVATAEPQVSGLKDEIGRYTALNVELAVSYEGYIEALIDRMFPKE
jgi:hypothetical protein